MFWLADGHIDDRATRSLTIQQIAQTRPGGGRQSIKTGGHHNVSPLAVRRKAARRSLQIKTIPTPMHFPPLRPIGGDVALAWADRSP